MRILIAILLVAVAFPAHAKQAPLTPQQMNFLKGMAETMQHGLSKSHAKQGAASPYEQPVVKLSLRKRRLTILNRFRQNPKGSARNAVRKAVEAKGPGLCLILQSERVRQTGLEIVMRTEMRSGSLIGKAKASPTSCGK